MSTSLPIKGDHDKKIGAYEAPLSVSAQDTPNLTVKVRAGSFYNGSNTLVEFIGGNSPMIMPPPSGAKWVLVGLTEVGSLTLVHGVNQAAPVLPAVPTGVLALAVIYVTATTTGLTPAVIQDVRPFLRTVDVVPNLAGELAYRPTFTDVANQLATKADIDGTPNADFVLSKNNTVGTSGGDARLVVRRGSAPEVAIRWNESVDMWELTNDGTNYQPIPTATGTFAPVVHTHVATDILDFTTAVEALLAIAEIQISQVVGLTSELASKASEAIVAAHVADTSIHHTLPLPQSAIVDLETALAAKADVAGGTFTGTITVETTGNQPVSLVSEDSGSSGVQVDRGTFPAAKLEWDESAGVWLIGTVGSMGQVLTSAMGTGVLSVNGYSGAVTLTASDVGAAPTAHTHVASQITDLTAVLDARGLNDVADVQVTAPAAGQVLMYTGTEWTNMPIAGPVFIAHTTTDDTPVDLQFGTTAVGSVQAVSLVVTGFAPSTGDAYAARVFTAFKNVAGTYSVVAGSQVDVAADVGASGWNVDVVIAGGLPSVELVGQAGVDIDWTIAVTTV